MALRVLACEVNTCGYRIRSAVEIDGAPEEGDNAMLMITPPVPEHLQLAVGQALRETVSQNFPGAWLALGAMVTCAADMIEAHVRMGQIEDRTLQ